MTKCIEETQVYLFYLKVHYVCDLNLLSNIKYVVHMTKYPTRHDKISYTILFWLNMLISISIIAVKTISIN